MNNFKKQLDDIKIPETLHKRSLTGIKQAEKERQMPSKWLPKILTATVTIAVAGFIFSMMKSGESSPIKQAAQDFTAETPFLNTTMIWSIAVVFMLLVVGGMLLAIKKGRPKKLVIGIGAITCAFTLNSAYFEQHQIREPMVLPIYIDLNTGNEFTIKYVSNKDDWRNVIALKVGNDFIQTMDGQTENTSWDAIPQWTEREYDYQYLRNSYFQIADEDVERIAQAVMDEESYLVFDDGAQVPVPFIHFRKYVEEGKQVNTKFCSGGMDEEGNDHISRCTLKQTATFDAIHIPKKLQEIVSFESITTKNGTFEEKDLPITVEEDGSIVIAFNIKSAIFPINTFVGLSGPNGNLSIMIFDWGTPTQDEIDVLLENGGVTR